MDEDEKMHDEDETFVGIDLGTWSSAVSWMMAEDKTPRMLDFGKDIYLPTSVLVNGKNQYEFGSKKRVPHNLRFMKRLFGRKYEEMKDYYSVYQQDFESSPNGGIMVVVKAKDGSIVKLSPFEAMLKYYQHLMVKVRAHCGDKKIIIASSRPTRFKLEQTRQMGKLCMLYDHA